MRAQFRFVHRLRVRWAEVDRQGVVFNAHYLTYFDVATTEYWRAIGYPYPDALLQEGCDLFAKKATLDYRAAARYDNWLDIGARVARIGRSSLLFELEIHRGDEHLVSGELVYVNVDAVTRRAAPVPEFLRAAISAFETSPPETATA
jgi:acyl-CoA thioester hydrolase